MASRKPQKRTIIVALWLAGSAGRKQLTGILRYVNNGRPWSVQLITDPKDFTNDVLSKAEKEKVDGIIIHADARSADNLATSAIPTVLLDFPPPKLARRTKAVSVILDSDEAIGEVAARYFLELGTFASYAFIPDAANRGWSRLRERGFERTLRHERISCNVYNQAKGPLHTWLKALPRPAAVLSAYDIGAQETIDACKKAGLEIPKQVSVLGVDNDELICDYTNPSISSVRIDHEVLGFEAARTLEHLMRHPKTNRLKKIFMPVGKVVERESTAAIAPGTHLVQKALAYIEKHACDGIGVPDVVRFLGVSRRLIDRRFSAATGSSIHRAIENCRLEQVKKRLKTTQLSIKKISRLCGYANEQRLKYVFKQRVGCSMSDWRNQQRSNDPKELQTKTSKRDDFIRMQ